jgi:hypothetical protein
MLAQQNQTIGPNPEAPVAEAAHQGMIGSVKLSGPVVNHHEIIAGALVFMEM